MQYFASVYHTQRKSSINRANAKLDTFCVFSHTDPPRRVDLMTQLSNSKRKIFLSQGEKVTLPIKKNEPRVYNLAVAPLRSY